jgi:hypothetical protein
MMIIYLLTHREKEITPKIKIKYFFQYVLSAEICYSIGVHQTFRSKFSKYADNIMITLKVINAMHLIFVSLPQMLIITVHSSSVGEFKAIDIISLIFSCLFIFWSIGYYFICLKLDSDMETELDEIVN